MLDQEGKTEIVRRCGSICGAARWFYLGAIFIFGPTSLAAQVTFERDHGSPVRGEYAYTVVQACNGGYYAAGGSGVSGSGHADAALLKIAENGDTLWWRMIQHSDTTSTFIESLLCLGDGSLLVGGLVDLGVFGGYEDYQNFMALLDNGGNVLWQHLSGGPHKQWGYQVRKADVGSICAGWGRDQGGPESDFYVVRFNESGDTLWTRTYGDLEDPQKAYAIAALAETNWVVVGITQPSMVSTYIWAVRINDQGDTLWTRTLTEFGVCYAEDAETLPNDHILITGFSFQGFGCARPLLLELDGDGELLWYQNYDNGECDWAYAMCKVSDGYAVFSTDSEDVLRLTRTDLSGTEEWTRTFEIGTLLDRGFDVQSTDDGGFVMTGLSMFLQPDYTDYQVFIIKTDSMGNVTTSTHDINIDRAISAQLFPNPVEECATLRFNSIDRGAYTLRLHDAAGKVLRTYAEGLDLSPRQHDLPIDLNGLSRGGYTLVLSHAGRSVAVKAIKR